MKYTVEIEIDVPRYRFIELFDDPANLPKWQKGLMSFQSISGEVGQVGAKSKLEFAFGKGTMVMIETITKRDLPSVFNGTYEAPGVFNVVNNRFVEINSQRTKWISENEFRFTTLFMKAMGIFMKSAFPKQSLAFMQDFKAFAENGTDVRERR